MAGSSKVEEGAATGERVEFKPHPSRSSSPWEPGLVTADVISEMMGAEAGLPSGSIGNNLETAKRRGCEMKHRKRGDSTLWVDSMGWWERGNCWEDRPWLSCGKKSWSDMKQVCRQTEKWERWRQEEKAEVEKWAWMSLNTSWSLCTTWRSKTPRHLKLYFPLSL